METNARMSPDLTVETNAKSIFHIPFCDDPIVEQGRYAEAFAKIKDRYLNDESQRNVYRGSNHFYIFLKNAYYVLEEQVDYIEFCNELKLDQESQIRYKMKEFLDECSRKLSEFKKKRETYFNSESNAVLKSNRKKGSGRVTFNACKNEIKYFLQEHCNFHHGNYTKLDKKEAQFLKLDVWVHPIQLKQKTEFKTKSSEIKMKRNILKIPSGQFLSTENLITDLKNNKTIELTLINLNKKNEFHGIPRVKIPSLQSSNNNIHQNQSNQIGSNNRGLWPKTSTQESPSPKISNENDSNSNISNQYDSNTLIATHPNPHVPGVSQNIEQKMPCNILDTKILDDFRQGDRNNIRFDIIEKNFTGNTKLLKNILSLFN